MSSTTRKACDRCHGQKLSCRRLGKGTCERCLKLKTECKFSPSLRYSKNQYHAQQTQQQQHQQTQSLLEHQPRAAGANQSHEQQPPKQDILHAQHHSTNFHQQNACCATASEIEDTALLHRRMQTFPISVQPDAGNDSDSPITLRSGDRMTGPPNHPFPPDETMLDLEGFGLSFDQFGLFTRVPNQDQDIPLSIEHLSTDVPHRNLQELHHGGLIATTQWNQQQVITLPLDAYTSHPEPPYIQSAPHAGASNHGAERQNTRHLTPSKREATPTGLVQGDTEKRSRLEARRRLRQITLRQTARGTPNQKQATTSSEQHWMAQLSEINASLLDLSSVLPKAATTVPSGRPTDERFRLQGFPIDEMFKLTRRVADILDDLSASPRPAIPQGPSKYQYLQQQHHQRSNAESSRGSGLDGMTDPGGSMFVLSTYIRLLDMYHKVFTLVRNELLQSSSKATFRFWKLPDVTVGSFAVESSPPLQMSLTVQLAEEFLSRLQKSTAALERVRGKDGGVGELDLVGSGTGMSHEAPGGVEGKGKQVEARSMFADIVDASYGAVRQKEESLRDRLAELRGEIEALLDS